MKYLTIKNSEDGAKVPALVWTGPTARPPDVHLLFHGLGTSKREYADFYVKLAEILQSAGHTCVSIDFRGHGDSQRPEREFTVLNSVSDGLASLDWCTKTFPTSRISLLGTSFGASIATIIASLSNDIHRLNLLAPVLDYIRLYVNPADKSRRSKYKGLVETAIFKMQPFPATEEISFYRRMVMELASISIPDQIPQIAIPVRIMHGSRDSLVPIDETQRLLGLFKSQKFFRFPGMDHGFTQAGDDGGESPKSKRNLERIAQIVSDVEPK